MQSNGTANKNVKSQKENITSNYLIKPREERDLEELYPDLDENSLLPVYIINNETQSNLGELQDQAQSNQISIPKNDHLKAPVFEKIQPIIPNPNIKFNRQLQEYGFQEPIKTIEKNIQNTYIRPFQLPLNAIKSSNDIETLIQQFLDKKKLLVDYDMDEQDYLFLKDRNSNHKNIIKITPEIFEILISLLENEWKYLEDQMKLINNSLNNSLNNDLNNQKILTIGHNNSKYGNDDGIVPGSIYDQRCAVCNDSDCDNTNAIVFCDGCDIAVHQECYGVAFIPEGQWLCRKCMINKNKTIQCIFCPSTTGAFKQSDSSLWSHVVCALWINELYFANPIYMEPIEGIENIPKSRWKLTCYICKQRTGACIQCAGRNCFQAYHVTCAKRAGLQMDMTKGVKGAINDKSTIRSFCEKHGSTTNSNAVLEGIYKTRQYFKDTKVLNEQNERISSNEKVANKLNIFKWQTEQSTPIAPKLFSDKLIEIMYELKVENQISLPEESTNQVLGLKVLPNRTKEQTFKDLQNISNEICRYWCLKRESKNGAPLVSKNNNLISASSILYNSSNNLEIETNNDNNIDNNKNNELQLMNEKLEFANTLVDDLNKLITINSMTVERQNLFKDEIKLDLECLEIENFPISKKIEEILNKLNFRFDNTQIILNYQPKNNNINSLKQIVEKNLKFKYKSIDEFSKDINDLSNSISFENKSNSKFFKKWKNWKRAFDNELYDYKEVLKDNDLSEIEIDEIELNHENKIMFNNFLKNG
ncbi:uncharacterized protein KGF55_000053 [Candida pseudojiufengensis]|uniref:uncharacterized protein n=1 Tax=Candida pseudojiufengensis TaxID=497109 RepID=UPI00222428E8|nr:uncharacterized protein KGF55_000053 [Candida pseudojiufengensis]KAI5967821.1 hypothetical protein KGF55_000053 [Candida pseudojiufengensis]